jgi:hypothetical protein
MPSVTVKIEWEQPDDVYWLGRHNLELALNDCCPNTQFTVTPWRGGWISVLDKLPEGQDDVLVFTESHLVGVGWFVVEGKKWYGLAPDHDLGEVTHWQPIPMALV